MLCGDKIIFDVNRRKTTISEDVASPCETTSDQLILSCSDQPIGNDRIADNVRDTL